MNAVLGNSEAIRIGHYIQPLPDFEYALLGQQNKKTGNQSKQSYSGNNTINNRYAYRIDESFKRCS
jgi:hypothetical protein